MRRRKGTKGEEGGLDMTGNVKSIFRPSDETADDDDGDRSTGHIGSSVRSAMYQVFLPIYLSIKTPLDGISSEGCCSSVLAGFHAVP